MAAHNTPTGVSANEHYSNFFLTVNTNFRPHDKAEAMSVGRELQALGAQFFTLDTIEDMIKFKYGEKSAMLRHVQKISVPSWSIELGTSSKGQRVHLHAFIKIVHHTWLMLSAGNIQAWFNAGFERLGDTRIKGVYANVRWIPASEEMAIAYTVKQRTKNRGLGGDPGELVDPAYAAASDNESD